MKLTVSNNNGVYVTDSREVAEAIDVRHSDLLQKIDEYIKILENGSFRSQDFFIMGSYTVENNNRHYKMYWITRRGCDMVANKSTGEKGVLFTAAYVTKFEEMERQTSNVHFLLPQNYKEALISLIAEVEKNEALTTENSRLQATTHEQEEVIHQLQPKASYCDMVLHTNNLISTTIVAKDFGLSAYRLNEILHDLSVQYRSGSTWVLYQKYADKGYAQTKTHIVNVDKSKPSLYWTQKGRMFIYELLKKEKGILPIMERESA